MRTTVRLQDELLQEVKLYAAQRGETLTSVLDRALRELLTAGRQPPSASSIALPSFAGRGLRSGVDLYDSRALLDLMEGSDAPG